MLGNEEYKNGLLLGTYLEVVLTQLRAAFTNDGARLSLCVLGV